jgi:hypothetical protein
MSFFKLILAFAPWIAFLIIAHGSLFRLELGLVVALVLSVGMGVARLQRGIILWVGLLFFVYATVAVAVFHSMWAVHYMGVLANGTLAAGSWLTIVIGKPFSLDYARAHTDPALWKQPAFIRTNVIITSVWAMIFTVNTVLAWGNMAEVLLPGWGYDALSYAFLIGAAAFTSWYPSHIRRLRLARQAPEQSPQTTLR